MVIAKNTVKKIMKSVIQKPISDNAIYFMIDKIENNIKEMALRAEQLLNEQNKVRKIQGMREKKRISREEINEVWQ